MKNKTARLTNSINGVSVNAFNSWGGVNYDDVLETYTEDTRRRVWETFCRFVIQNYQNGKGTFIKGFGTFTYTNIEYSLEGTTNQYDRDKKIRRPVFIVSAEFLEDLRPGIFNKGNGLIYYTQKINNSIGLVKINYAELAYSLTISKEEYVTVLTAIIKQMADVIRLGEFKGKQLPGIGQIMLRGNVLGVKFNEQIFEEVKDVAQKYIQTKKNVGLFMETSHSKGVRQQDIRNIDKAIREIRPTTAVLTHISTSGEKWLQQKMNINLDSLEPDDVPNIEQLNQASRFNQSGEFYLNQKPYRETPQHDLAGLNIPQDILEGIAKHKDMLVKTCKAYDRHNNSIIPKFELSQAFLKANVHHRLIIETINKIVSLYTNSQDMIDYPVFFNNLIKDINIILRKENTNFPIDHYQIGKQSKRQNSSYSFNRSCGNFSLRALNSIGHYPTIQVQQSEVQIDIERIKACIQQIINTNAARLNKTISFIELIGIFQPYSISLKKEQMIKILKFLSITNPNSFNFFTFASAIKATSFEIPSYEITKEEKLDCIRKLKTLLISLGGEDYLLKGKKSITYDDFAELILPKARGIDQRLLLSVFYYVTGEKSTLCKENYRQYFSATPKRFDENYIVKAIGIIVSKIHSKSMKPDDYYNHLLGYNMCRKHNAITFEEFQRLFQLEQFSFDNDELNYIFNFIDFKNDSIVDREEWNQTMKKIHHPLLTMQNYIRKQKLDIEDILYKMGLDAKKDVSIDKNTFKIKVKFINDDFENQYLFSLFDEIDARHNNTITTQQIIEAFNVFKKENVGIDCSAIEQNRNTFTDLINQIQSHWDFTKLKSNFMSNDKTATGRLSKGKFLSVLNSKGKQLKEDVIMKFIRFYKLMDLHDNILYPEFCELIYETGTRDNFSRCIEVLKTYLNEDCNNDLFLFFVKMNNMANASSMQKWLSLEKLYEFFRNKVDFLQLVTINSFDLDNDGIVSFEDLKNIIIKHINPKFFSKKEIPISEEIITEEKFKQIVNDIKTAIKKKNMTEINLFQFLDEDKDSFITYEEFSRQLEKIVHLTKDKKDAFFDYLDFYHHGYINIEVFLKRIKMFMSKDFYVGNYVIETVALSEFSKWYNRNLALSDTEVFSLLDHDSDGIISVADMKHFVLNTLTLSKHEVRDSKIMKVMQAISLNQTGNITLNDIRDFMTKCKANQLGAYLVKIKELCNIGVTKDNYSINQDWIKEMITRLGMYVSERYTSIASFYEENCDKFTKVFKCDQLKRFIELNPSCFDGFAIEKDQINALFTYFDIGNKKYLTADDFDKKLRKFNYYHQMENQIRSFMKQNFPSALDAFKYFNNSANPNVTSIAHKEFFDGLNYLFPKKYSTETLLNYIRRTFPQEIDEIPFSKFNFVYFEQINFDHTFPNERWKTMSKILTTRHRENLPSKEFSIRPFSRKDHEPLQTPFDSDPLNKIKRIIISSKYDYSMFFNSNILLSDNGFVNQFEFRNLIKKLDLGLTNIEIEDIISHVGKTRDGRINLKEFYKYISTEDQSLKISKENILTILKQIKTLIYKYYSSPKLAFEFNDMKATQQMDFEKFKKVVADLYTKNVLEIPNYAILKYVYDYIDVRKDGVINLQEWNRIFAITEGELDIKADPKQMKILREWETSTDIDDIYRMITKNKKIIKTNAKEFFLAKGQNNMIQMNNLVNVLKDTFPRVKLSTTQWKMIASAGDRDKSGFIDYDMFMGLIEASSNRRPYLKN